MHYVAGIYMYLPRVLSYHHDDTMRNLEADPAPHCVEQQQFKGVRKRNRGKWVSEIRMPNTRDKIWLGSYPSAEQAARAYDVAAYLIRGPNYVSFNFPTLIPPDNPSPFLAPKKQHLDCPTFRNLIRDAAVSAAASFPLPPPPPPSPPPPATASAAIYNDSFYGNHVNAQAVTNAAELIDVDSSREQTSDRDQQEWIRSLFTKSEDNQQELNLYRVSSLDFPSLDDYAWTPVEDFDEDDYDSALAELGRLWNI